LGVLGVIRLLQGDCREVLKTLPAASVHCCVTSPPYFGLRDYGVDGQIGLEATPDAFVSELVSVFREVRRVLRDDGTLWLNLGDSYNGSAPNRTGQSGYNDGRNNRDKRFSCGGIDGLKTKDLIGVPWLAAFALRADGWYLRRDIIWAKRNCMPESVRDRPTSAHEYIFLLTKQPRYYYDATAIEEDGEIPAGTRAAKGSVERAEQANGRPPEYAVYTGKRNKRSVWWVATQPFSEAHFATFPPDLIEPCILAGTSEKGACAECGAPWVRVVERIKETSNRQATGKALTSPRQDGNSWNENDGRGFIPTAVNSMGWSQSCQCSTRLVAPCVVLDPFGGAGTTGLVSDRLGRDAVLIELNPTYADMARKRITNDAPLFASVA
jgi:DNA modification methylase